MRIPLTQGAYEARSIIASAQRAVNLYSEKNPSDAPVPFTHYQTPGLDLLISGTGFPMRCSYRASNGDLYLVIGSSVYYVDSNFNRTLLGTIPYRISLVSMADNGLVVVIVDGSNLGWVIDMPTHSFGTIPSGGDFYGSIRVDYLDTFLLFSVPATNQWYISLSDATFAMFTEVSGSILTGTTVGGSGYTDGVYTNILLLGGSGGGAAGAFTISGGVVGPITITNSGIGYVVGDVLTPQGIGAGGSGASFQVVTIGGAFNPLDIATKNGYPDPIQSLIVMHREIWLIGQLTTEIWYDSGAVDFAFQAMPGAFVEHGTIAPYSVCAQDLSVYFLSSDKQGRTIFMRGAQYQVLRISTHAIENEWAAYQTVTDAIAFTYQQEGHTFVFLQFPSANKTWVYDQATELWHERAWTDNNGILNRHRANCYANAYNKNLVGDWQNGNLYQFDLQTFTDNIDGNGLNIDGSYPISFIRSFPHLLNDGKRVVYNDFQADLQVGTDTGAIDSTSSAIGAIIKGTITGGTTYTNGTYIGTPLTGGTGQDAIATLVVSGGIVTSLTITSPGQKYNIGDILSASGIGSGTGFFYTITNISSAPTISMRFSDTRGASYGNFIEQSMGAAGQYLTNIQWRRLGMARDRVFELSWSTPTQTALNGAFVEITPALT